MTLIEKIFYKLYNKFCPNNKWEEFSFEEPFRGLLYEDSFSKYIHKFLSTDIHSVLSPKLGHPDIVCSTLPLYDLEILGLLDSSIDYTEGIEVKTKTNKKGNIQFNSHCPSSTCLFDNIKVRYNCFIADYETIDNKNILKNFCIFPGAFFNKDDIQSHSTTKKNIGTYKDGFERNRKLYEWKNPIRLPSLNEYITLITEYPLKNSPLESIGTISRVIDSKNIDLYYKYRIAGSDNRLITNDCYPSEVIKKIKKTDIDFSEDIDFDKI